MNNELKLFLEAFRSEAISNSNCKVFLFTRKRSEKYRLSLIKTGVFDGNEKMVRLTISKDDYGDWCENTYTVIKDDGGSYSWHSGTSGYTCVSDQMKMKAQLMHDAKNELFKDN